MLDGGPALVMHLRFFQVTQPISPIWFAFGMAQLQRFHASVALLSIEPEKLLNQQANLLGGRDSMLKRTLKRYEI